MGDVATLPPKINDGVLRRWNAQRGQRNGRGGRYKRLPSQHNLGNWVVRRLIEEIIMEDNQAGIAPRQS
ncbi:hypothetical protein GJO48_11140 [Escherichia coli]|nr:hypothetical protein [Salmonella enterica subsp. enterica serovar Wagenia]EFH8066959.1 hypothetical protein [Escherichia coli]